MNDHPDSEIRAAMNRLLASMDFLNERGYRVSTQDGLYFTNGSEDLELHHDFDDGWYYEVEDA